MKKFKGLSKDYRVFEISFQIIDGKVENINVQKKLDSASWKIANLNHVFIDEENNGSIVLKAEDQYEAKDLAILCINDHFRNDRIIHSEDVELINLFDI